MRERGLGLLEIWRICLWAGNVEQMEVRMETKTMV